MRQQKTEEPKGEKDNAEYNPSHTLTSPLIERAAAIAAIACGRGTNGNQEISEEEKKQNRLEANRKSAAESRRRKKEVYLDLEKTIKKVEEDNKALMEENEAMRSYCESLLAMNNTRSANFQLPFDNDGKSNQMKSSCFKNPTHGSFPLKLNSLMAHQNVISSYINNNGIPVRTNKSSNNIYPEEMNTFATLKKGKEPNSVSSINTTSIHTPHQSSESVDSVPPQINEFSTPRSSDPCIGLIDSMINEILERKQNRNKDFESGDHQSASKNKN